MTLKKLLSFLLLLCCQILLAQNDTIVQIREVIITDTQLHNFSNTQKVQQINDSAIKRNQPSLTSLLNFNSVIYFKENGYGMVSSPSFRGTTAQQTAVVWNGININSQLNGQTDFNTINTRDFTNIAVRAGGGSVIYGSSAIGGTIHLNNEPAFGNYFNNELLAMYGSFNTLGLNYKLNAGTERFAVQASITRNSSDNNYEFIGSEGKNLNGQFSNTSFNTAIAYKLNDKNTLKLYNTVFDSERHFSLIFPSETRTKYKDANTRTLLEWQLQSGKFTSKVKAAYLSEEYRYFQNIYNPNYTYGRVETTIGKYDLLYAINSKMKINTVVDYNRNKGYGSDIGGNTREISSGSVLFSHSPFEKFMYEAGLRQEITDSYQSPLLYSLGFKYRPVSFYTLRVNASKNFRIPTFNDLYWQGSGNTELKPESSYQAELGNDFTVGDFTLGITGYYIKLTDMLRWVPAGSVWRPENTEKVTTYGAEVLSGYRYSYRKHTLQANATYAYTSTENELTGKQLTYVPQHKATASLAYSYGHFSANVNGLYTGEVFTRTDNNSRYNMKAYTVANGGISYGFGRKGEYVLGGQVFNIFNADYQVVDSRPMPGRNFTMYININL